jgi:signal transduction histidine kinase
MRKIPLKLVLVVAVSAAIITLLLLTLFFVRFQEHRLSTLNPAQGRFIQFLLREIATDSSPETVHRLASTYRLHILVQKAGNTISSDPKYFLSEKYLQLKREPWPGRHLRRPNQPGPSEMLMLKEGKAPVGIEVSRGPNRFVLVKYGDDSRVRRMAFLVTFSVVVILAFLFFLVKRWLADPLSELETAIRAFPECMYTGEPIHGSGDLRRLFDAFSEMKEQVRQTVSDKERLLRDVSHDLKSPITRMRVAVEMLSASPIRDRILRDLSELQGLVNQVLDVQRRKNFRRERVQMDLFLSEFLTSHEPGFPVQLDIRAPFSMRGNQEQLSRVLENLLDNSGKYADTTKGVVISCYRDESEGVVDVSDSGNGIGEDVIARIFDPFFKEDESRRQDIQNGSGLGLAICRTIVEAMDGDIRAGASRSGGLLIQMRFPIEE